MNKKHSKINASQPETTTKHKTAIGNTMKAVNQALKRNTVWKITTAELFLKEALITLYLVTGGSQSSKLLLITWKALTTKRMLSMIVKENLVLNNPVQLRAVTAGKSLLLLQVIRIKVKNYRTIFNILKLNMKSC
jgi:hypothetical protein